MNKAEFFPAEVGELANIRSFLRDNDVLFSDINQQSYFILCRKKGEIIASVGLEIYGENGLLRSLAVRKDFRGLGLGKAALKAGEDWAEKAGCRRLYLLTTNAKDFFANQGYVLALRDQAPEEIRKTPQFAGLCPATAAFMVKAKRL